MFTLNEVCCTPAVCLFLENKLHSKSSLSFTSLENISLNVKIVTEAK